ncbi:MAG TPA: hypothetical protein VF780_05595 [Nitrosospira sp.]
MASIVLPLNHSFEVNRPGTEYWFDLIGIPFLMSLSDKAAH